MANENRDGATGQQSTLVATWSTPTQGQLDGRHYIQSTLTFNRGSNILRDSVDGSDFEVINASGQRDVRRGRNWTVATVSGRGLDEVAPDGVTRYALETVFRFTAPRTPGSFPHTATQKIPFAATLRLKLKANSLRTGATLDDRPATDVISASIAFDNRDLSDGSILFRSTIGGLIIETRMWAAVFDVTGIQPGDFSVFSNTGASQTGWTISVSSSTARAGVEIAVTAAPPIGVTSGTFRIQINPRTIRARGSSTDNFPINAADSGNASLSSLVVTWGTPAYCETSNRVTTTLTFGNTVTGLTNTDIEVRNEANTMALSGWSHAITGSGRSYTINTTPPANTIGDFKLRLKQNSVSVSTKTGPSDNEDSALFNVGGEMASITIDSGSFCTTSRKITWQAYITGGTTSQVGELDAADVTINNSVSVGGSFTVTETLTRVPSNGSSYRIETDAIPTNRAGNMSVTIRANALGANSNRFGVTSACVSYDTRPPPPVTAQDNNPYLVVSGLPTTEQTGMSFSFTVTAQLNGMNVNIDGLTADDFVITSPEGSITPTVTR